MPTELRRAIDDAGAAWMPFGPPANTGDADDTAVQHEVAETFGEYEAEYAAIRRHVGVLHLPWRRVLPVSGADVRDFLHRLMSQDLASMTGGQSRRSLMLDERGHILADTVVHFGDEGSWIELDAFDAQTLWQRLDAVLFSEDVTLGPVEETQDEQGCAVPAWQNFALMGPAAVALVEALREPDDGQGHPALTQAGVHQVVRLRLPGHENAVPVSVYRHDETTGMELRLWVKSQHAAAVYRALLDAAGYEQADLDNDPAAFAQRRRDGLRGRPVGWLATNTARIEAGTPMFHIDVGPDCVPAEAGLIASAVSFTKGCYVGQEAVARMKNLGHPKKLLVGLRLASEAIPVAGTQVFDGDGATIIGAITSSAVSPMRGQRGVALAMMRWGRHEPGTQVVVVADGQKVEATVSALDDLDAASTPQPPA